MSQSKGMKLICDRKKRVLFPSLARIVYARRLDSDDLTHPVNEHEKMRRCARLGEISSGIERNTLQTLYIRSLPFSMLIFFARVSDYDDLLDEASVTVFAYVFHAHATTPQ